MVLIKVTNNLFLFDFFFVFVFTWFFFFKFNFFKKIKKFQKNKKVKKTFLLYNNYFIFLKIYILNINLFLVSIIFLKGFEINFFWNKFFLSNATIYMYIYLLLFFILYLLLIFFLKNYPIQISNNFCFALVNLSLWSPIIFFTTTLLSIVFVIEITSCLIFFCFITGVKTKKNQKNENIINILYFQFWSNFFGTILFLFSIILLHTFFGTTSFFSLKFLSFFELKFDQKKNVKLLIVYFIMFIGFIIKTGITPIHLYKIEIYKNLSYLILNFYTGFFFFNFFFFFLILILNFLEVFKTIGLFILFLFCFFGFFFLLGFTYFNKTLKGFFAYSTLLTSLNALLLIAAYF